MFVFSKCGELEQKENTKSQENCPGVLSKPNDVRQHSKYCCIRPYHPIYCCLSPTFAKEMRLP